MAVSPSPQSPIETKPDISNADNKPDPSLLPPPPSTSSSSTPPSSSQNPNSNSPIVAPHPQQHQHQHQPPLVQSPFTPISPATLPPSAPSFRPVSTPPIPQFSPLVNHTVIQNPNFQNPNVQVQPPGVSPVPIMVPGVAPVAVPLRPGVMYQQPPHPGARPYGQIPNGYSAMPPPVPQGMIPPPGIPRYPSPYPSMVRPMFPPRPPGVIGMLPPLSRPPVPGVRGVSPVIPPVTRPVLPIVTPTEKPQTTVYVGKIAPTVENDFMLSLLRLCGPVKSWKNAQVPSDGTSKGFGFCEFESAEGVLRALRLLSKLNVDGQELVLNVNQATRDYLERYVEKKTEREKLKETETEGIDKEDETAPGVEKKESLKSTVEDAKKDANGSMDSEVQDSTQNFGVVTDEDRENDRDALEKLTNMLEERLKTKPLPPPPPRPPADASGKPNSEVPTKSRDVDSDDIVKSDVLDDKNDEETTSENKHINEQDRTETSSPDRNRRHDRRSKDKDRERDLKREKERELERYERERERERVRRERERETKVREAERKYKESVKEWESRERDKEYQRQHEREREKERERERKREIIDQEDENDDDDTRKRRRRSSVLEEKRKKRQREKDEDKADRLREEEEIAEGKRRAIEEQLQHRVEPKPVSDKINFDKEKISSAEETRAEGKDDIAEQAYESDSAPDNHAGDVVMGNGIGDETTMASVAASDARPGGDAPARKLGFGLVSSGKRTSVPSVFHEEDDDEATKDKKMRPLVPIDYSTEEIQAVQLSVSETTPPNLAAAAEFAKRISGVNPKEERFEGERERNRRSSDRSSHRDRDRDRNDEESNRSRDDNREKNHDRDRDRGHGLDKPKASENKKLLDAKQLIDMIPKTKEELFSYDINWAMYDKHDLHERMRPWISKKITEFLGEEETTLVDYIVNSTKDHVRALQMLELLQPILDDEAEMFVLKMWRMLIFEIKKVETGLSLKSRT